MGPVEWGMLLVLSVLWGGSFFFAKIAVTELSPFTLVFYRVFLAAIVLLLYLKLSGRNLPSEPGGALTTRLHPLRPPASPRPRGGSGRAGSRPSS